MTYEKFSRFSSLKYLNFLRVTICSRRGLTWFSSVRLQPWCPVSSGSQNDVSASARFRITQIFLLESGSPTQNSRSIPQVPIPRSAIWATLPSWFEVEDYLKHLPLYGSQHPVEDETPHWAEALATIWVWSPARPTDLWASDTIGTRRFFGPTSSRY